MTTNDDSDYELQNTSDNDEYNTDPQQLLYIFQNIIKYNNKSKLYTLINPERKTIAKITMNMILLEREYNEMRDTIKNFKDKLKMNNNLDYNDICIYFQKKIKIIECDIIHNFNSNYKKLKFELDKINNNNNVYLYLFIILIIVIVYNFIKLFTSIYNIESYALSQADKLVS